MTTILSKDIQSLIQADKIDNNYTVKRKILWGPDGIGYDVTTVTPLPVQVTNSGGSGWANFGADTPKQVSVANTSTELLPANPARVFARISNNSAQTIFIQYSIAAVYGQGLRLCAGATLTISSNELFLGSIQAITQTGTVLIDVIEGEI